MTKTVVKISYSNAVVPEFDSSGRPDLLGWDAAMESHDSEEEVLAVFHDDDIASLCKPVIKEFFEDVDLNEMYQSDDVDLRFQKSNVDINIQTFSLFLCLLYIVDYKTKS